MSTRGVYRLTNTTQIELRKDARGRCSVPLDPNPVGGNHKATLTWTIVNHCDGSYDVKLDHFARLNADGKPGDPATILDPAEPEALSIERNARHPLRATIRDNADYCHYKYRISIRPKGAAGYEPARDPDIDIWPY
jgi:hypothetical protein